MSGVTLTLTGSTSDSTLSDDSGNYQFTSLPSGGIYVVTPTKVALPPGSAGIDTVDIVTVQRHLFNDPPIPPGCQLMAADVNGDNSVDTVDVIAIQRFFLGQSTGTAHVGEYQFTPASRSYPGIVSDQTGQNYDTLVFGDVASHVVELLDGPSPPTAAGAGTSAGEVPATVATLSLPNVRLEAFGTHFIVQATTTTTAAQNKLVGFHDDFVFHQ
jgi:hypothetical protein